MFLARHAIEHPSFAQILLIMQATPPNTSPVKCGFSQLEMIATKHRKLTPENLKHYFLLAALKISVKPADCYENEMKILEQ